MKKIKYLTIIVLLLLIVTGCKSKTKDEVSISKIIENTSISETGVKSYRMKVSIRGDEINQNYIVLNKNNKKYEVTLAEEDGTSLTYVIKDGVTTRKKESEYSNTNSVEDDSEIIELQYDYTNTNLFLEGLNTISDDIKIEDYKINDVLYKKYEFPVTKETMNKILKPFSYEVKSNGSLYALVDEENRVYVIVYNFDDININVSYTSFNSIK